MAEAIGYDLVVSFPGSINITRGRRNALIVTIDSEGNLLLLQVDEGSVSSTAGRELLASSQAIIGERKDISAARSTVPLASAFPQ